MLYKSLKFLTISLMCLPFLACAHEEDEDYLIECQEWAHGDHDQAHLCLSNPEIMKQKQ